MGYRVLSASDIKAFTPPTWLANSILFDGGLSMLFGPSNIGKSFVALDLAHSISTGERWMGRRVRGGHVVYVAAGEGVSGLRSRIEAWEYEHDIDIDNVSYITEAVQLHQTAAINKFIKTIRPLYPTLVIFDTLARCFVGGDENTVKDMGQAISAADEIRELTGAAVMFVHHSGHPDDEGKLKKRARGSSGLPAALDTSIEVVGEEGTDERTLFCRKQKDAEWFHPIEFEMRPVRRKGRALSLVPSLTR